MEKRVSPGWGGRLETVGIASEKALDENQNLFSKNHLVGVGDLVVAADDLQGDCEDLGWKF